jgi:thiol-disulfide isomerase/thioredoxin
MVINETPRSIPSIIFEDFSANKIDLKNYKGKLVIVNFWATWCAPCKKEMPSLDNLYQDNRFKNLEVFAVNMEEPNGFKTKKFYTDLNIKKLKIFFDPNLNFVKEFNLRGVPTTVLINKKGEEFARIIGEVDFKNKKFLNWLSNYD